MRALALIANSDVARRFAVTSPGRSTSFQPRRASARPSAPMQIIRQDELGETEVLKLTDVPIPEPGIGEIVVRVHAAGV
jgi:hypothetical protein